MLFFYVMLEISLKFVISGSQIRLMQMRLITMSCSIFSSYGMRKDC